MSIKPFINQIWDELKVEYNEEKLFEDPFFSVENILNNIYSEENILYWKRPKEVYKNAEFVVNGLQRRDVNQGELGNCWFIASIVGVLKSKECIEKIVPLDQGFGDNYNGMFHFRFWQYGDWVDVVIDDRLPFDNNNKLIYSCNNLDENEMWVPLLEKAYAKLKGSYAALESGRSSEAFLDLTGGISESFSIKETKDLWKRLLKAFEKKLMISCNIDIKQGQNFLTENNLVRNHAYNILKVCENDSNKFLVLRNPNGNFSKEWTGDWCEKDPRWEKVSLSFKRQLSFKIEQDGEFTMSFESFCEEFDYIVFHHFKPDTFNDGLFLNECKNASLPWNSIFYHGEWKEIRTTGGSNDRYWTNPQYLIAFEDDDFESVSLVISLIQKNARSKMINVYFIAISFTIYKVLSSKNVFTTSKAKNEVSFYNDEIKFKKDELEEFLSFSSMGIECLSKKITLKPGIYVIIPNSDNEYNNDSFLLRIFVKKIMMKNEESKNRIKC